MKSAHTPGPWYAPGDGSVRVESQKFGSVRLGSHWRESAWLDDDADEEVQANARLIAAAPDLLAAVKLLLSDEGVIFKHRVAAEKAIAKAEHPTN